jgi:hypothetical protein
MRVRLAERLARLFMREGRTRPMPPVPPVPPDVPGALDPAGPRRDAVFTYREMDREVVVRTMGPVELALEAEPRVFVASDGRLEVFERDGTTQRRLLMTAERAEWTVDGRPREFGADGRDWLNRTLRLAPEPPPPPVHGTGPETPGSTGR